MTELSRAEADKLNLEIHEERRGDIRVAVDRWFDANEDRLVNILVKANVTALNQWSEEHSRKWLARFGVAALGSMILGGLAWLGWKGWSGK